MTMKQGVYTFAIALVIHILSVGSTTLETVWVKDATEKRTLGNIDLPDELVFHLTRRSETLKMNLRRNHDINPNADVYFAQKLQNGKFSLVQSYDIEKENLAYYQDINNGAFMTVRCVKISKEQCDRIIRNLNLLLGILLFGTFMDAIPISVRLANISVTNGNVRIGDRDYALQPAKTDVSSKNILEDLGALGRQYVLQVETHPLREYSFENKDAAQEMETNRGEKRMTLTRRFQEQHKQKHLSAAVTSLPGTNESTLHKSGGRDKSRQSPQIYYVKVAVVIDKGLWDFYFATAHSFTALTRRRNAIKLIHQCFSHIMNGVNMIYKGIEDTSIRITVVLNQFIIFKSEREFQHIESRVQNHNGKPHIDGILYLNDAINWDNKTAVKDELSFSHGMVFTRYKLYLDDFADNEHRGFCYTGEVCNIGRRMSIVEISDYVWTVRVAAHELGHSLGADHDGDEGFEACKAEDQFLMSSAIESNYPGQPYTKNPWIFSKCSINAFKRTLPTKTCVRNIGRYYDYDEYHKFVMKEPGVEFSPDRQCELIVERKSVLCETTRKDICLLMRCTDPQTGICIPEYRGAARGTECGQNNWCIDGRCVPKG